MELKRPRIAGTRAAKNTHLGHPSFLGGHTPGPAGPALASPGSSWPPPPPPAAPGGCSSPPRAAEYDCSGSVFGVSPPEEAPIYFYKRSIPKLDYSPRQSTSNKKEVNIIKRSLSV